MQEWQSGLSLITVSKLWRMSTAASMLRLGGRGVAEAYVKLVSNMVSARVERWGRGCSRYSGDDEIWIDALRMVVFTRLWGEWRADQELTFRCSLRPNYTHGTDSDSIGLKRRMPTLSSRLVSQLVSEVMMSKEAFA